MQTTFWDTNPNSPSSGSHIQPPFCDSSSQTCGCTKKMPGCSMHPSGLDEWTACMRDFLARILALPEWEAVLRESEAVSGRKLSGVLMQYDPQSCSLKTVQQSFLEELTECYQTLPRWGSMRNGAVYPRPELVRHTDVIVGGCLRDVPTPTTQDNCQIAGQYDNPKSGTTLGGYTKMWPTAIATAAKGSSPASLTRKNGMSRKNDRLDHAVMATDGGQLNPTWVEWLMGWPIGSTESRR